MSVLIGHARGGDPTYTPGDQSGAEVRTQNWYLHTAGWHFLARFKDAATAERAAKACEAACANNNIGYSQTRRNDLRAAVKPLGFDFSRLKSPADCDCASLMAVCIEAAGVDMTKAYTGGNAPWTGNMREKLAATGAFEVLTDSKYLVSDQYLRRGDILVNEPYSTGHTCMVLSNGPLAVTANAITGTSSVLSGTKTHVVEAGETLWGISRMYGVTVAAICEANGIDAGRFIFPGQKLVIP